MKFLVDNLEKGNLVDLIPDHSKSYTRIETLYSEACQSMEKWRKKYDNAINLAKLQPTSKGTAIEHKTFPFDGASLVMMPYIIEAMLDFQSRASPDLVWDDKIVTAKIYGKNIKVSDSPEDEAQQIEEAVKEHKSDRADRVSDYMNYQLIEEIPYWRDSQDSALMMLPNIGTVYKKSYFDHDEKMICSDLCRADKVIFDMGYNNFEECPHKFEEFKIDRDELISYIRGDQQWDISEDDLLEDQYEFEFIRAYTKIDLDEDGISEPYEAVIYEKTRKIVCLYPCYDEDGIVANENDEIIKIKDNPVFTQYQFLKDPGGGPMGMGWGILLGPMFTAINGNMRQLIDAGTLSVAAANSGIVAAGIGRGRGTRQTGGPIEVRLGELTPVDIGGIAGSLRDNVMQFPFSGPSPVLFQLVEYLITSARSMTNAATNVEANPGEAASLYLARLQEGLKLPNSIAMRVYSCAKEEFKKIHALNYKYHDSEKYNRVLDQPVKYVMSEDFNPDDCDIRLAGDPSRGSDVERIARAQTNLQLAMDQASQNIQVMNVWQATKDLLEASKAENVDELLPKPQEGPSQEMQLMLAERAKDAELKERDQVLRENEQRLKEQKTALEAAKEMTNLGLAGDEQEARITKMYAETLKILVEAGIASGDQAIAAAQNLEDIFIDAEGGKNARITGNQNSSGALVERPGNEGLPEVPGALL